MTIDLPPPNTQGSRTLADCIGERRSIRQYAEDSISTQNLSELLWSMQGVTGSEGERATPSAGGLYPFGVHVIVRRVAGLVSGIYTYEGAGHSLKLLNNNIPETFVRAAGIGDQPWLSDSAIIVGISANIGKAIAQFSEQPPQGKRGIRYVYIEGGAMAQNALLRTTDLGYGGVLVAGFNDSQTKEVLMLPAYMEPVALLCIGSYNNIR